jgi:hypothetical protein
MKSEPSQAGPASRNRFGQLGLMLSAIGLVGIVALGTLRFDLVRYMTLCSFLGLAVSVVGVWRRPRAAAVWGILLGAVGSMFLPTVFLPSLTRR